MVKLKAPIDPKLAKARSQRIKDLRKYLKISVAKLAEKYAGYGLTVGGLDSWEKISWNGLTEGGATLLAKIFRKEGLNVTVEWLMFGVGESPIPKPLFSIAKTTKSKNSKQLDSEKELIEKELQTFYQNYPNSIHVVIDNDSLAPSLMPGDHVAGIKYTNNEMERAIGHPSIVQLTKKKTLVRMVTPGKDLGIYTLTCTNPKTTVKQIEIKDVKPLSVAPIIWIRKPEVKK